MLGLFQSVKNNVTTRQAAERYGLRVGRGGMCKCPFHNDKNPSMKVDRRFHCFGCLADGDVISFTSRLFNDTPKEAALRLTKDFGIQYDPRGEVSYAKNTRKVSEENRFAQKVALCYRELCDYRNLLVQWQQQYAPKSADEALHPRFIEALHNLEIVEYQLDVLLTGSDDEKRQIVNEIFQEMNKHEEVLDMEPIGKTPVYRNTGIYALEHGELEQSRQSHRANLDCKRAIEESISKHFDGMRLDRRAVSEVMEHFAPERVALILASTVSAKEWDGRFSPSNKQWALSYPFPASVTESGFDRRHQYAVTTHSAVLDGFISLVRQQIKEREHPAEKDAGARRAAKAAAPIDKPIKKKPHSYER